MNEAAKKLELERDILKEKNAVLKEQNAALLSTLERARNGVGGLRRAMEERGEAIALASLDGIYMDIDEAIAAAKGESKP
jgi:hypothetical protein